MQRYFVDKRKDDYFYLNEDDTYHVTKVMRMKLFEYIEVVYDGHLYLCEILSFDPIVECKLVEEIDEIKNQIPKVIIAQALVKEQKMDYILQKSCELGVSSIIPYSSSRSLIKVSDNDTKKITRWQKILKEASEQSKRCDVPSLDAIVDIRYLINLPIKHKYLCSVNEKSKTIKSILSNIDISDTIIFVIGPEGGLADEEEEKLIKNGYVPVSLGTNVLRTETASSFVLSAICYEFMR